MMPESPNQKDELYRVMPKVDLHRHLEGSLRVSTLKELAAGVGIPSNANISSLVQMQGGEAYNMVNFLAKFQTLRQFYQSPEIISRVAYEAVADAAEDSVRYLELMFTPVALSRIQGFPMGEVMDWVCAAVQKASRELGIGVRLIASVNRHEAPALAAEVAQLAVDRISKGVVALNLAGNETDFPAQPFRDIFRDAKTGGLAVTIHAGEWGNAENVREAIEDLQADRIGHGVRVLEDPDVTKLAAECQIPFEVCITSNFQTGVTPSLTLHPIKLMIEAGLNVILSTDDPGVSAITLSNEYHLACETLGLTQHVLAERIIAAANASFLSPSEKNSLVHLLNKELYLI